MHSGAREAPAPLALPPPPLPSSFSSWCPCPPSSLAPLDRPPVPHPTDGQSSSGPRPRPVTPHYQAEHSIISLMDGAESQASARVMDGPEATIGASRSLPGLANLRSAQEAGAQHASQLRCTDKPRQSAGLLGPGAHIRKLMGISVGSASWQARLPTGRLTRLLISPCQGFVPLFPLFPVCNKHDSC